MRAAIALAAAGWLALAGGPAFAQAAPDAAEQIRRYEAFLADTDDPSVRWLLAEAYAGAGERAKALEQLARVADLRMDFFPARDSALHRLKGDPTFEALLARMGRDRRVAGRARVAFELREPGLLPEGVAYDAAGGRLLVGDQNSRRVLAADRAGRVTTFAGPLSLQPLGMTVDAKRGRLWVATTNAFTDAEPKRSELLALDLRTGAVVERLAPPELRSLNDVTVAPNGDVWVSDTAAGSVLRFRDGRVERMTPEGGMSFPNGVAVSDDGRHVFVAQGASLRRIDAATGVVARLAHPPELTTLGVDGLYWMGQGLVAVQNGGTAGRVLRLSLSQARDAVVAFEVLEGGSAAFEIPTTGAPAPGRLYVLANSQLDRMRPDGAVAEPETLKPILILETPVAGA